VRATGAVSWRAEGLLYRKNEIYIDIIESVNVLLSNRGTVLKADVVGKIVVKT
jgi:AP-2 complex subunit mu-1